MAAFLFIFAQVLSDLSDRLIRWLAAWLAIGGILVGVSAAHSLSLAISIALVFLFMPVIYLTLYALISAVSYWRHEGLVLLFDVTRRQFYKDGHVHEVWTRQIKNASPRRSEDTLDVPMFWDIPLEQIHPVAIHVLKKTPGGRYHTDTQAYEVSRDRPEYSERLFEGRKFFGCVIPVPLGLEAGESMFLKLIYRHTVSTPLDDQIIRAVPRLLRLTWEGNANDGLKFIPEDSYVEARHPDPMSAARRKETKRASRYLRFEEADTRMIFDLPRPKPGYHYRVVFKLEEMLSTVSAKHRNTSLRI